MISACTIVARNFLPQARVLAQSFAAHHPGGDFTVLLIDDEDRTFAEATCDLPCRRLSDIGLSPAEIAELVSIYDVTELATAVKPPFLRHLLAAGRDHILYLDPDIKIYDSLGRAAALASRHGIVLTPHMTAALPRDGLRIDDAHILSSGIYNLGFIGIGAAAHAFLDWWWSRTRRDALVDHDRMMFTDQRWIDYVPAFFDHYILKDPGYNVAYWNLHHRDLVWTGQRYVVGGQPLAFFHFSGYSPDTPHLLSKHQGDRPRILLSERPALRRICAEYQADLQRLGWQGPAPAYAWGALRSGLAFDRRMRRVYRSALLAAERDGTDPPPAPFADEEAFVAWLQQPVAAGRHPRVSRYLYSLYEDRADLRAAFPHLEGDDCQRYFMWLHGDGVEQEGIPAGLLPPLTDCIMRSANAFERPTALQDGVNLAGYFRAELGIGEVARILRRTIEHVGVPYTTIEYNATDSRRNAPYDPRGNGRAPYDVNIVCVNADRAQMFARDVGPQFFAGRYSVGYWFWELEQFPARMHAGFDAVDEVWAATRFVAGAIERVGRRPVRHVPLALPPPRYDRTITRATLELPDGFLFLFTFDFFSVLERKNPLGVIEAFRQAFEPGEGPTLVLKSINGHRCVGDLERMRAAALDRPDIRIVDGYYTAEQKNAIIALCDCYVSLHRAEGLGLTLAEAMALARPVIATGYSGNLDFMNPDNSYLVDYSQGSVPAGCGPYPAGSMWADPCLDQAAALMRRVYENRREAKDMAARARQDIETKHGLEAGAAALRRRLDAIRRTRVAIAPPSADPLVKPPAAAAADTRPAEGPTGRIVAAAKQQLFRILRLHGRLRRYRAAVRQALRNASVDGGELATLDARQRQALERLWTAVHALEARLHHRDGQNTGEPAGLATRAAAGGSERSPTATHETLEERVASLGRLVETLQHATAAEIEALRRRLDELVAPPTAAGAGEASRSRRGGASDPRDRVPPSPHNASGSRAVD